MFYIFSIISFCLGAAVGSFLNVLIYRLSQHKNILGRSFCPYCQHQLSWYDLIPIFSFLFLGGRCGYCKNKISIQYPLVEIATGLLFLFVFLNLFSQFYISAEGGPVSNRLYSTFYILLLRDWLFIATMIFVFVYDLRYMLIEDIVILPAIAAVFLLGFLSGRNVFSLLAGGLISWLFFWLQYLLTKKKGVGEGDLRLGILMGVMFGWPRVLLAIFISYIIGGFISLILIIIGKKKLFSEVPLGPFLALGSLLTIFFGSKIIDFYLGLSF